MKLISYRKEGEAHFGGASGGKGHHLVREVDRPARLIRIPEKPQPLRDDSLEIGLADIDDVVNRRTGAEGGVILPARPVIGGPQNSPVGVGVERAVVEVRAQEPEFPELIGDVLPDVRHRPVGADQDLLALGQVGEIGAPGEVHHPAPRVLAFSREGDGAGSLQQV